MEINDLLELDQIISNKQSVHQERKGHIYFLLLNDEVVYVGQTIMQPETRIKAHTDKVFDSYSYFECDIDLLTDYEVLHIIKYKPLYNKILPNNELVKSIHQLKKELKVDGWKLRKAILKSKLTPFYADYYMASDVVKAVNSYAD